MKRTQNKKPATPKNVKKESKKSSMKMVELTDDQFLNMLEGRTR